jgi:hypothetical protein
MVTAGMIEERDVIVYDDGDRGVVVRIGRDQDGQVLVRFEDRDDEDPSVYDESAMLTIDR